MNFYDAIDRAAKNGEISHMLSEHLKRFSHDYIKAATENNWNESDAKNILLSYIEQVKKEIKSPFSFPSYHKKMTTPFNYYELGLRFVRPLVDLKNSHIHGKKVIERICHQLESGENVILFANHQIEPDPQLLCLLLSDDYSKLIDKMIFVAGHRVTSDPLAVPITKGTNLLCIFSKKYIDDPPEKKLEKMRHNQKTMKQMGALLSEGGKCIYVAPSGGRDRPGKEGIVEVAPFDDSSTEMFWLIAKHAKVQTHFYPLALDTYSLLPPPDKIIKDLGEERTPRKAPISLWFGDEIDMEHFDKQKEMSKQERREARSLFIFSLVKQGFALLKKGSI